MRNVSIIYREIVKKWLGARLGRQRPPPTNVNGTPTPLLDLDAAELIREWKSAQQRLIPALIGLMSGLLSWRPFLYRSSSLAAFYFDTYHISLQTSLLFILLYIIAFFADIDEVKDSKINSATLGNSGQNEQKLLDNVITTMFVEFYYTPAPGWTEA